MMVGQPVTFSGTGCASGVVRAYVGNGSETQGSIAREIHPNREGHWSATVQVDPSTPLGSQLATATCLTPDLVRSTFNYYDVPVTVNTFYRLQVSPSTSVRAGTRLDVKAIGPCTSPLLSQGEITFRKSSTDRTFQEVYGVTKIDTQGNWSGHVTVPASAPPGRYELVGSCVYSRSYTAWYPTVPMTVAH